MTSSVVALGGVKGGVESELWTSLDKGSTRSILILFGVTVMVVDFSNSSSSTDFGTGIRSGAAAELWSSLVASESVSESEIVMTGHFFPGERMGLERDLSFGEFGIFLSSSKTRAHLIHLILLSQSQL
jgi:hypothetical protein